MTASSSGILSPEIQIAKTLFKPSHCQEEKSACVADRMCDHICLCDGLWFAKGFKETNCHNSKLTKQCY